jgi:predicted DNA binding protein
MDGASLRRVTFRVEHDCPMARFSREVPQASFTNWAGHRVEVVEVRCPKGSWDDVVAAAQRHLKVRRSFPSPEGGLLVIEVQVDDERSISRILEANRCIWLQPMRVDNGWESYDAIAYTDDAEPEQSALAVLSKHWPTQVVRRISIGPEDVLVSLFLSLRPVLEAPTDKQAEALVEAARKGYYKSPRQATTAEVAQELGLGRSAFEERLRGAENRILGVIAAILERHRQHP